MNEFWPFFVIISVGVLLTIIGRRLHVPWVLGLIAVGAIFGPHALNILPTDSTLTLAGQMGLMFLMFMAGLETRWSTFTTHRHDILVHSTFHALIPLAAGLGIGLILDLSIIESIVLGIVFISSSIAIIIPSLESEGVLDTKVGKILVGSTVIVDAISLLVLSVLLEALDGQAMTSRIPYIVLICIVPLLRILLPKIERLLTTGVGLKDDEQELRVLVLVVLGTALVLSPLGLHPIIGGFFAGVILSDTIRSPELFSKLHALGYGIFIPIFFIQVGMEVDVGSLILLQGIAVLTLIIFIGTVVSKFLAGYWAGRIDGYSVPESELLGVGGIPRLSTTLVAVFAAAELQILSQELVSALVISSILTTVATPYLLRDVAARVRSLSHRST